MKLTATVMISLITSILFSAMMMTLLPGNAALRFGWSSLMFPLVWPLLTFLCYWPERAWLPFSAMGTIIVVAAGVIWMS